MPKEVMTQQMAIDLIKNMPSRHHYPPDTCLAVDAINTLNVVRMYLRSNNQAALANAIEKSMRMRFYESCVRKKKLEDADQATSGDHHE